MAMVIKSKFMSQDEYVGQGGGICPSCEEDGWPLGEYPSDGDAKESMFKCECGTHWVEVHGLVGYRLIDPV